MPAGGAREARNLAAHRDRIEPRLQRVSNRAAQRANLPDSRRQAWGELLAHQQTRGFPAAKGARLVHSTNHLTTRTGVSPQNADSSEQVSVFIDLFPAQFVIDLSSRRLGAAWRGMG